MNTAEYYACKCLKVNEENDSVSWRRLDDKTKKPTIMNMKSYWQGNYTENHRLISYCYS